MTTTTDGFSSSNEHALRATFEQWALSNQLDITVAALSATDEDVEYESVATRLAWRGWEARACHESDEHIPIEKFLRYRQALYRANGFLIMRGFEPVKLEYPMDTRTSDQTVTSTNDSLSSETNDTAALTELAAALRPIIDRDEQRGMPTTGLESAAREIEWAARRDRPTGGGKAVELVTSALNGDGNPL